MHKSVLLREVVESLNVKEGGAYVDCTLGSGGHAYELMKRAGGKGILVGFDKDGDAIKRARRVLSDVPGVKHYVNEDFSEIGLYVRALGIDAVDGIVLDLGISSDQLDDGGRGFSFMKEGPLDMRMDNRGGRTAADFVNEGSSSDLNRIISEFGEERRARRIVGSIIREREKNCITTTAQLAAIVEKAVGGRRGRIHPATKVFQALRIAVNGELDSLSKGLVAGLDLLKTGGRMAVISFHSLEDRIVKRFFVAHAGRFESLPMGGEEWRGDLPLVKRISRKPIMATDDERLVNPRSRSAKLRVIERG